MKRLITVVLFAALLALTGCAQTPVPPPALTPTTSVSASPSATLSPSAMPSPSVSPSPSADTPTAADYFPFTPNVHMSYLGAGNEYAGFESYVDYINNGAIQIRTNNGGTELAAVYTVEDGALKRVFSKEETYFRVDYTAERSKSEVMLMEPLTVGTTWTLESGNKRTITATDAAVSVPYGTFQALEVTTEYDDSVSKDYYVRELGLVKREFIVTSDPSYPITSELQAVTTEPFTQNVRFFYSDQKNDRIVFADKSIRFNTNDTAAAIFQEELKAVPPGSGLSHVLTENAEINSINYDAASGIVTVDLSKSFITEMNLGSGYEGQVLECLGDTLGSYFMTEKVAITIEGAPYESGHFLFNTGDYLPYNPDAAAAYKP